MPKMLAETWAIREPWKPVIALNYDVYPIVCMSVISSIAVH